MPRRAQLPEVTPANRASTVMMSGSCLWCAPPVCDVPDVDVNALIEQQQHGAVPVGHRRAGQRRVPADGSGFRGQESGLCQGCSKGLAL